MTRKRKRDTTKPSAVGDASPTSPKKGTVVQRKVVKKQQQTKTEQKKTITKAEVKVVKAVKEVKVKTTTATATNEKQQPPVKKPKIEMGPISSNWKAMQKTMPRKRKVPEPDQEDQKPSKPTLKTLAPPIKDDKSTTKLLGLDCEMVGVGVEGEESMLARVCIINSFGNVIYDKFVKPRERVVDYRTWVSGVTRADMKGPNSFPFETVQKEVAELIKDRIIVGHGLENDFKALLLSHPFSHVRDTAKYRPLQRSRGKPMRLRYLVNKILGVSIQEKEGAHDPAEDARAAMMVYKHLKRDWEEYILKKQKRFLRRKKKVEKAKKKLADKQAKLDAAKQKKAEEEDAEELGEYDDSDLSDDDTQLGAALGFGDDDDDDDDDNTE